MRRKQTFTSEHLCDVSITVWTCRNAALCIPDNPRPNMNRMNEVNSRREQTEWMDEQKKWIEENEPCKWTDEQNEFEQSWAESVEVWDSLVDF